MTTTTPTAKHRLVASTTRRFRERVVLAEYGTYDEAVAAYKAADAVRDHFPTVAWYAVRSADDPKWAGPVEDDALLYAAGAVRAAVAACRRAEIGATALWAIRNASPEESFFTVVSAAEKSLRQRGWTGFRTAHVVDAVKARVLIGRCRSGKHFTRQGWWLPRSEGPLAKVHCPDCGGRLNGTSLALSAGFRRLPLDARVAA